MTDFLIRPCHANQDALRQYTPRQIRILFLTHNWASVLDYKRESMEQAITVETTLKVWAWPAFLF